MIDIGERIYNQTHSLIQALINSPDSEESFWSNVGALGTPLFEPDPKSSDHTLVTFVAQLPTENDHIVVQPGGFSDPPENGYLEVTFYLMVIVIIAMGFHFKAALAAAQ